MATETSDQVGSFRRTGRVQCGLAFLVSSPLMLRVACAGLLVRVAARPSSPVDEEIRRHHDPRPLLGSSVGGFVLAAVLLVCPRPASWTRVGRLL